jgi:ABC-type multidrug transport system ATPase subunit
MQGMERPSHAIYAGELAKRYGTTTALAGLGLAVPPGVIQGVLGPNGAGKTTLIRILATLLRPDAGRALLTMQDLAEADRLASRVAVIGHGRVIASGTPAELKAKAGGQSLDVRPAEPGQLTMASAIVAEVLCSGGVPRQRDGTVTVPLAPGSSGTEALAAVSLRLGQAGVQVAELGLRLASLDEVFLSLAGPREEESR